MTWLMNSGYSITHQVVSQQLHDECGILVALLTQGVKLGNGIIECLLGQVASLIWRIENLIVKDREVEGETKADGMCWSQVSLGNFRRILVGFQRFVGRDLALVAKSKLSQVTVVISLPTQGNISKAHIMRSGIVLYILW